MNPPPSSHFHYYNHNFHDPTLVNVHTLLNPQPFKHHTPPSIPTFQSATAQYWALHPPITTSTTNLFNHGLYQHYPYSSPNYINPQYSTLRSEPDPPPFCFTQQQTLNTPTTFNPLRHNPFYHPSTSNSSHHTKLLLQQMLQSQQALNHAISKLASDISTLNKSLTPLTHTAEPSPCNTTHIVDSVFQVNEEEKKRISDPVTKVIEKITSVSLPELSLPSLVTSMHPPQQVMNTRQNQEDTKSSTNWNPAVEESVFSKVDGKPTANAAIKIVPDSIRFSCSNFAKSLFRTIPTLPEKMVVHAVAVTLKQHPHFTFQLPVISIHIFDPGGKLSTTVCSVAYRCLPILSFRSFTMFTFATLLPAHQVLIVSLISLVWEPWDRGKKGFNYMNTFSLNRRRCRSFLNLGITGVVILQMVADTIWVATIRLGPKEYTWIGSFNGMTSPSRILIVHGASVSN